ncbi:MAG: hypothetical protein M3Q07_12895 [Pseudobdellovibrionaceae bacterium]|nr:hypothetical protein [Pseudobdellovibrionaceae bacterium]
MRFVIGLAGDVIVTENARHNKEHIMNYLSIVVCLFSSFGFSTERVPFDDDRRPLKPESVRCTMEYDPAICTYLDISVEGSNRCVARAALQSYANAHNIEIDPSQVVCVSGV